MHFRHLTPRGLFSCSSWEWGVSAMESLHEFLRWGPYGFYATFVLMILAIPLGWMYAYIACVGKRRDITEPDPTRRAAAWGGAILIALLMFVWRHLLVSDTHQYPIDDFMHWMYTGYMPWIGGMFKPLLEWAEHLTRDGSNILVKLFGLAAIMVLTPASVGVALFGGMALILVVLIGAGVLMVFAFAFVTGALSAALWFLPGFLIGVPIVLYFLFVRLPLQVAYRRAIREGRWPTTAELVLALRKGTLDKADWQSKIMAYKSRKFEAGLNRDMERISRRTR